MEDNAKEYKGIFKSTFLFSFVQIIRLLAGIIRNKVAAVILGPYGMGIIGVYNTTISFIKTGAGLGISQSAVRDVSEANGSGDRQRFSRTIALTNKIVLFTALFGLIVTITLSPLLSEWGFGNKSYTLAFVLLSLAVAFEIYVDNQLAILKGMRKLRSLAIASIWGSLVALVTGVSLIFFWGEKGIIPSIIISSLSAAVVSIYYVRKVSYDRIKINMVDVIREGKPMMTMGISLMIVSFLAIVFDYVVIAYIRSHGGLEIIGVYTAGTTIITSYFGIVISAMTTDYYPRISAINHDNLKLCEAVNQQSEVGLVMVFPLAVLFLLFSQLVMKILYSEKFYSAVDYMDYAMIGSIVMICSNSMGMILLAKQKSKIFLSSVIGQRVLMIVIYLGLYTLFGLRGLGYSYCAHGIIHFVIVVSIMGKCFDIGFNKRVLINLLVIIISCLVAIWIRKMDDLFSYALGSLLFVFSLVYTYLYMKRIMNMNIFAIIANRVHKNK